MIDTLRPDWAAPPNVSALVTTRHGGFSSPPWQSANFGDHVGDDPAAVAANRAALRKCLPGEPVWLRQVHGTLCVDAAMATSGVEADAAISRRPGVVCAVLTADCLPVFLCDTAGTVVGVAHAGWRGLVAGVIEATVAAMAVPSGELLAWFGPAIGPQAFEVGDEVRAAFIDSDGQAAVAFVPSPAGRWYCDLYRLAGQRLEHAGVRRLPTADFCTHRDASRFFSYRRDGVTGRMANLIWLA